MKIIKIFLNVIAIALMLSTLSIAFSEEENSPMDKELQILRENGIIEGDPNGDIRGNDELTRAEFATVLCRAIGVSDITKSEEMKLKNYFSDVTEEHWAAGAINIAKEYGAINGFDDGNFYPELTVTNEQVIKMLVAAWGYSDEAENLGGYPNGYLEIAKKYGVTDPVLFNCSIASKRWVAFTFTYGALSMPPKNDINIPITTEMSENKNPKPENNGYVKDPALILNKITPESAKYERTIFEQSVPKNESIPFELIDNNLLYTDEIGNKKVSFSGSKPDEKETLKSGDFTTSNSFDISDIPVGKWRFNFVIKEGAVTDSYFLYITKLGDEQNLFFDGEIWRYTSLNVQPVIAEVSKQLSLSNEISEPNCPFKIKALENDKGEEFLTVEYPFVLEKDYYYFVSINDYEGAFDYHQKFDGSGETIEPIVIENLKNDTKYHVQIGVYYEYGDDIAIKGDIKLIKNDTDLDYIFDGNIRTIDIEKYTIISDDF